MASKVFAFELRDDKTVKKRSVKLSFPRAGDAHLYIITNQRSRCHILQDPEEEQSFQKTSGITAETSEKTFFQHGVSTKVFSVTDPTETQWEVRLLLSPSEFTRLSSTCNLIGYLSTYLMQQLVSAFDVQADHLPLAGQEKTAHVIFRNPCPDNWASGGRKCAQETGETFEFGLCHKIFSMRDAQCEIQFLQSLQESYGMVAAFHIAAFAERLLMTKKWRKTLDLLLKEGQKPAIDELSQLAAEFVCNDKCDANIFQKYFRKEMIEKRLRVQSVQGGEAAVISVFGVLVAIAAALKAKSIADNPTAYSDLSDEDAEPEVDHDRKNIGLPKTEESGSPKTQTIGLNLEENNNGVHEEKATGNIGGMTRGVAGGHTEGSICSDSGSSSPFPNGVSHPPNGGNQVSISNMETSGAMEPSTGVLPAVEPQGLAKNTPNVVLSHPDEVNPDYLGSSGEGVLSYVHDTCKSDGEDPDEVDATYLGSSEEGVLSYVHDTKSGSRTTYNEETIAKSIPSRPMMESSCTLEPSIGVLPVVEPQGLAKNTPNVVTSACRSDGEDPDEVDATYLASSEEGVLSYVRDTKGGSRSTYDEDTTPNSDLESSCTNLRETPKTGSGGESLTLDSQIDPSKEKSPKTKKLEVYQVGQKQDHPLDLDLGREDRSNGRWATRSFPILLVIIIVALAVGSFVVPSRLATVIFTGLALMLGVYLFLSRRT